MDHNSVWYKKANSGNKIFKTSSVDKLTGVAGTTIKLLNDAGYNVLGDFLDKTEEMKKDLSKLKGAGQKSLDKWLAKLTEIEEEPAGEEDVDHGKGRQPIPVEAWS